MVSINRAELEKKALLRKAKKNGGLTLEQSKRLVKVEGRAAKLAKQQVFDLLYAD